MNLLDLQKVRAFVNENIDDFHQRKLASVQNLTLARLLTKNPYLFKAKNINSAGELIAGLLDAFLSSSEEKLFGDFLEGLAVFVAGLTCNGHKSAAQGIDLEFINNNTHYIVSIKSGPHWGNSSQHKKLAQDLRDGVTRIRQSRTALNIQPVLGICYGKTRSAFTKEGYLKVVGQNFWYLISENPDLYTDIIDPIGYRAKEHNEQFIVGRAALENRLTGEFITAYCDSSGAINWERFVQANSKNLDLDTLLPKN